MVKVLVAAAGSKAGAQIVRRLRASGTDVRTTTHLSAPSSGDAGASEAVRVDFLHPASLAPAFAGIDKAVLITPEDSAMVAMTTNLVDAATRARVEHLVLISFIHADRGGGGSLLSWHRRAEEIVLAAEPAATCLRPNYYMQNFLCAHVPAASLTGARVSYIDAADVAEVAARVLVEGGHEGKTYSLTGPEALSMEQVGTLLRGEHGRPLSYTARGWEESCLQGRRSAQSEQLRALCEFWLATSEDEFAIITPTVEQLIGRPPTEFARFVREHRGEFGPIAGNVLPA